MKSIKPRQPKHETRDVHDNREYPIQKRSNGPGRIRKACEPCRLKKARCDGKEPCSTCKTYNRTCVFSERHRREIRKWVCDMQGTIEEAIQRLYYACEKADCFPGILPDKHEGVVTTESILRGLGLDRPDPPSQPALRPQRQRDQQGHPTTSKMYTPVDDLTETLFNLAYPRSIDYSSDATSERSSRSPTKSTVVLQATPDSYPLSRTASSCVSSIQTDFTEDSSFNPPSIPQWSPEAQFHNDKLMRGVPYEAYNNNILPLQPGSLQHFMAPHRHYHTGSDGTHRIRSQDHITQDQFSTVTFPQQPAFLPGHIALAPTPGMMDNSWAAVGEQSVNILHMPSVRPRGHATGWSDHR